MLRDVWRSLYRYVAVWRRNWSVNILAVILLVVVVAFFSYAEARQQLADARQHEADVRAEKQRQAICAILANIPGHIPAEIANARRAFARPAHLGDCQPIMRPRPTVTVTPTPRPATAPAAPSTPAGVITPIPAPDPSPSRTASPRPTPRPSPTRSRSPSPSPSPRPTCHRVVITVCT